MERLSGLKSDDEKIGLSMFLHNARNFLTVQTPNIPEYNAHKNEYRLFMPPTNLLHVGLT